ncbi:hypothetical protein [Acaryochloris sp. IP29b_bin.148]|uniref:hypothetical protein n=1 Tax=Acaryochloris sp. IP29b_bin.148 TaxID=2969218 RepID=UPI00262D8D5F|nr:hypothetical protein [Acaryochloris sp. IP29b_bin.148]
MTNTLPERTAVSIDKHTEKKCKHAPRRSFSHRRRRKRDRYVKRSRPKHFLFMVQFITLIGGILLAGYSIAFFPKSGEIHDSKLSPQTQRQIQDLTSLPKPASPAKPNIWVHEVCNRGYQFVEYDVYKTCVIPGVTHDDVVTVFGWDGRTISSSGDRLVLRWEASIDRYFEAEFLKGRLKSSKQVGL